MTTKAQYYNCATRARHYAGEGEGDCEGEVGFYLDPTAACDTYSQFGRLPTLSAAGSSIVCNRPGRLAKVFDLSDQLDDLSTMFVDRTVK